MSISNSFFGSLRTKFSGEKEKEGFIEKTDTKKTNQVKVLSLTKIKTNMFEQVNTFSLITFF